jgi:hypothetical protein
VQKNIDDYQNQMNQASDELSKVEREVAESLNQLVEAHRVEEQRLLDEERKLKKFEEESKEGLSKQRKDAEEFRLKLEQHRHLMDDQRRILEEKLLEKTKLEKEIELKKERIIFNKQLNSDLEKIVELLEKYNIDQEETEHEVQKLLVNQDQIYKDLCTNIIKSNKEILDKIYALSPTKRAQLLLEGFTENDSKCEIIKKYASHMGFDPDYLAKLAFQANSMEAFEYGLSNGANPCNYSKNNITLLQKIIHSGKQEYINNVMNGKSLDDVGVTLLSAIKSNDLVTINKLSEYYGNIFTKQIMGVNFIEFVIHEKNEKLFDQIISQNPEMIKLTNSKAENVLHTALKYGSDNMILKIINSRMLDLHNEASILTVNNQKDSCARLKMICTENNIELLHGNERDFLEGDVEQNLLCIGDMYYDQDLLIDSDFILIK